MSGVLQKPEQSFWGRLFKAKTGVVRGDPGTKRAAVATILFRSVPLRWVTCGSLVGCCWDLPCWLPSFEVSVVEPLAHCTTVTQSGVCAECHNKHASFLPLACTATLWCLPSQPEVLWKLLGGAGTLVFPGTHHPGGPAGMCWWPACPTCWRLNSSPVYVCFWGRRIRVHITLKALS